MQSTLGVNLLPDPYIYLWVIIQNVYVFSHQIILIKVMYFHHLQNFTSTNLLGKEKSFTLVILFLLFYKKPNFHWAKKEYQGTKKIQPY